MAAMSSTPRRRVAGSQRHSVKQPTARRVARTRRALVMRRMGGDAGRELLGRSRFSSENMFWFD